MKPAKFVTYALVYGLIGVSIVVCAIAAVHAIDRIAVYTWSVT